MVIGLGVILLVAGLILALNVVTVGIPHVDDNALGIILIVAGVLAIVLSLIVNAQRNRRATVIRDREFDDRGLR